MPRCCDDIIINDASLPMNRWADFLISCACCPLVAFMYIQSEIETRRERTNPRTVVTTPPKSPALPVAVREETEEHHPEITRDEPTMISPPKAAATTTNPASEN